MNYLNYLKSVCKPSQLFAIVSVFTLIMMMAQNMGTNYNQLCVGLLKCRMSPMEKIIMFGVQIIYVSVWVIILDSLCKNKYGNLAWALVLFPFISAALGMGAVIMKRM